jgi:hypothetical protein
VQVRNGGKVQGRAIARAIAFSVGGVLSWRYVGREAFVEAVEAGEIA